MNRVLFHGSERIIEMPVYKGGKPYNDYGYGFYCTENESLAKEWAAGKNKDGFVNKYNIIDDELKILNLTESKYNILHWLALLLQNRSFDISLPLAKEGKEYLLKEFCLPYYKYDVIIGYRADDSYFSFAQDFLSGAISLRQLNYAMHLGKMGEQYVIKSRKAFDSLNFMNYSPVDSKEWYLKSQQRDLKARKSYYDLEKNRWTKGDIFITRILEEEIKSNDMRLR